MNKNKTVECGDWFLGWGYGIHNKLGKLTLNDDQSFTWKGYSQGRHGRKWNQGAWVHFTVKDDNINVIDSNGSYPVVDQLLKGTQKLNLNN